MTKFDKSLYKELGKQLKAARLAKGWSLQDVSDKIGGIKTRQTIMRYENGETRPDINTIKALCNVLGLDPDAVTQKAKEEILLMQYKQSHREDMESEREYFEKEYGREPTFEELTMAMLRRDEIEALGYELYDRWSQLTEEQIEIVLRTIDMFVTANKKE